MTEKISLSRLDVAEVGTVRWLEHNDCRAYGTYALEFQFVGVPQR